MREKDAECQNGIKCINIKVGADDDFAVKNIGNPLLAIARTGKIARNRYAYLKDKEKIQQSTSNQRNSNDWIELRKNMITASNFGTVVKEERLAAKLRYRLGIDDAPNVRPRRLRGERRAVTARSAHKSTLTTPQNFKSVN
ncbi:hypothetical protein EVAR_30714_1 [Eumeta japonica]|uniref:Uncharacterized protein n=1 Tax=Eumeta variegata TaxID=151549 RepID=A0A4C1V768_EUMVA|nr:hypothetical protein EVAR_30714_1 [Eumeta japonica]